MSKVGELARRLQAPPLRVEIPISEAQKEELIFHKLDLNDLIELEDRLGISLLDAMAGEKPLPKELQRISTIRLLLYFSLRHAYPDISEQEVGELLSSGALSERMEKILSHIQDVETAEARRQVAKAKKSASNR